jgi:hypothetical protein
MTKTFRVYLTLSPKAEAAREVAEAVLMRANPHDSELVHTTLTEAGITVDNLQKYFIQLANLVTQFWHSNWDVNVKLALKPHEIRNLYLPLVYGVIFSSVGNYSFGNYEYLLKSSDEVEIDSKFLIQFSAKLETVRHYVKGAIGQIGNRGAQPQTSTMMTILGTVVDKRTAEVNVRDGVNADKALAGLAALAGLSLVEEAYRILYTGVEEVNFRQVTETLVDKGLVASHSASNSED